MTAVVVAAVTVVVIVLTMVVTALLTAVVLVVAGVVVAADVVVTAVILAAIVEVIVAAVVVIVMAIVIVATVGTTIVTTLMAALVEKWWSEVVTGLVTVLAKDEEVVRSEKVSEFFYSRKYPAANHFHKIWFLNSIIKHVANAPMNKWMNQYNGLHVLQSVTSLTTNIARNIMGRRLTPDCMVNSTVC